MTAADAAGDQVARDDAAWREITRLRPGHPGWVIIWLSPARKYRAYKRLPGARRDTALTADTPEELSVAMTEADRSAARKLAVPRQGTPAR